MGKAAAQQLGSGQAETCSAATGLEAQQTAGQGPPWAWLGAPLGVALSQAFLEIYSWGWYRSSLGVGCRAKASRACSGSWGPPADPQLAAAEPSQVGSRPPSSQKFRSALPSKSSRPKQHVHFRLLVRGAWHARGFHSTRPLLCHSSTRLHSKSQLFKSLDHHVHRLHQLALSRTSGHDQLWAS